MQLDESHPDSDKARWQAEEAVREAAYEAQKLKWKKARERSARRAQRKLKRLADQLADSGELSDWEQEFTDSVCGRLDQFGSAFQDREKGRPADALSFSQKKVMAAMRKKAAEKAKVKLGSIDNEAKASFAAPAESPPTIAPPPKPPPPKPPMVKKPFLRVVPSSKD